MTVKIGSGIYMSGMPCMDYSIDINGVRISLSSADMKDLIDNLDKELKDDYEKALKVKAKYDKNISIVQEFRNDMRTLFFDGDSEDEYYWKKSTAELKRDDVDKILEKYNSFLGFK
jgi:hypothetical protein